MLRSLPRRASSVEGHRRKSKSKENRPSIYSTSQEECDFVGDDPQKLTKNKRDVDEQHQLEMHEGATSAEVEGRPQHHAPNGGAAEDLNELRKLVGQLSQMLNEPPEGLMEPDMGANEAKVIESCRADGKEVTTMLNASRDQSPPDKNTSDPVAVANGCALVSLQAAMLAADASRSRKTTRRMWLSSKPNNAVMEQPTCAAAQMDFEDVVPRLDQAELAEPSLPSGKPLIAKARSCPALRTTHGGVGEGASIFAGQPAFRKSQTSRSSRRPDTAEPSLISPNKTQNVGPRSRPKTTRRSLPPLSNSESGSSHPRWNLVERAMALPCKVAAFLGQAQRKLRVAIFDASRRSPHPAAMICLEALTQTAWFNSQTVARLLTLSIGHTPPPLSDFPKLSPLSPVQAVLVRAHNIRAGCLCTPNGTPGHGFDVIVIPGGSTRADLRALAEDGREAIQNFVKNGGGYCGICAGGFVGLRHLRLVEASVVGKPASKTSAVDVCESSPDKELGDIEHNTLGKTQRKTGPVEVCGTSLDQEPGDIEHSLWAAHGLNAPKSKHAARGQFLVDARFTKAGRRLLWSEGLSRRAEKEEAADGSVCMRYHNGPIIQVPKDSPARVLCRMWPQEGTSDQAPPTLSGAVAIVMQEFGGGRAVIISPHPESTQDSQLMAAPGKVRLRRILQRAVLLAASGPEAHKWIEHTCHLPADLREAPSRTSRSK